MHPEISVSIRHLTRNFGLIKALDDVSIDVRKGELLSLLGPSGCGKTTLLRIIGGFEEPSSGEVLIGNRNVIEDPPYLRKTNMVFQHLALFPHLSVGKNVSFGLEMNKVDQKLIQKKVKDVLSLVRLPGYEDRSISMLSGGQKQRVAIARAIINEPSVLLLDEPLGALDLQLRLQMHEELKRIHKETNSTWIFVTHDQGEAIVLSDRIAVMSEGQIVQLGTPEQIYQRPANRFVAQFIGHANLFESFCESLVGEGYYTINAKGLSFKGSSDIQIQAGLTTLAVIRYEKVLISTDMEKGVGFSGVVQETTYLGSSIRVVVQLENAMCITSESTAFNSNNEFLKGMPVRVSWNPQDLLIMPS